MGFGGATGKVWIDLCLLLVLGFVSMVIMLLPFVNPPGDAEEDAKPPGAVMIWVYWQDGNIDTDTWVLAPGETKPIGYSNKNGKSCNLLRDDLGAPDIERNFETVYCRGVKPGRYWVNVHAYRSPEFPVEVRVEVSVDNGTEGKSSIRVIAKTTLTLERVGDERTAFSFVLDEDGEVDRDSLNSVFRPLRETTMSYP
jgi:hypothetical protein